MSRERRVTPPGASLGSTHQAAMKLSHSLGLPHDTQETLPVNKKKCRSLKEKNMKASTAAASQSSGSDSDDEGGDEDEGDSGDSEEEDADDEDGDHAPPRRPEVGARTLPAIRLDVVSDDESVSERDDRDRVGLTQFGGGKISVPRKKRTYSNLSATSLLDSENDDANYPRKRMGRRLSSNADGMLKHGERPFFGLINGSRTSSVSEDAIVDSSDDENDDDVYNAVEFVSESEEGEPDVEGLEEHMIIQEEEFGLSRRSSVSSDISNLSIFGENLTLFPDDMRLFDDGIGSHDTLDFGSMAVPTSGFSPQPQRRNGFVTPDKRVRWADEYKWSDTASISSSSSSGQDVSNLSDIFVPQDTFYKTISYLGIDMADTDIETPQKAVATTGFGGPAIALTGAGLARVASGASGYEPDGDKTDEDENSAAVQAKLRKRSASFHKSDGRRVSTSIARAATEKSLAAKKRHHKPGQWPTRGFFPKDPSRRRIAMIRTYRTVTGDPVKDPATSVGTSSSAEEMLQLPDYKVDSQGDLMMQDANGYLQYVREDAIVHEYAAAYHNETEEEEAEMTELTEELTEAEFEKFFDLSGGDSDKETENENETTAV